MKDKDELVKSSAAEMFDALTTLLRRWRARTADDCIEEAAAQAYDIAADEVERAIFDYKPKG
jgi:hypothetical protein